MVRLKDLYLDGYTIKQISFQYQYGTIKSHKECISPVRLYLSIPVWYD